jgi:hypothetical protein
MSSEEEICKTCAKENHHDRTAHHNASSPQVQATAALTSQQGKTNTKALGNAGTESDYQIIAATKPSLISIVVAAQATTWKPRIAGQPNTMSCASSPPSGTEGQDLQGDIPKEESDAHRPTEPGLSFHPIS